MTTQSISLQNPGFCANEAIKKRLNSLSRGEKGYFARTSSTPLNLVVSLDCHSTILKICRLSVLLIFIEWVLFQCVECSIFKFGG